MPRLLRVRKPASNRILRWCETVGCDSSSGSCRSQTHASWSTCEATIDRMRTRVGSPSALNVRATASASDAVIVSFASGLQQAAWSPDGTHLAGAVTAGWARIWEAATGKLVRALEGHGDWVTSAVFSPDGRFVLTGSGDKAARIWEAVQSRLATAH